MSRALSFLLLVFMLCTACSDKITNVTNNNGPDDWQPPMLSWLSPPEADVRGTVGIDVSVTDSSFISAVRLYLDGVENQSVTQAPFRFEVHTDSLTDGVHLLEARAWDEFNNMGVSPILRMNVTNTIVLGPHVIWVPDSFATIQAAINASTDYDTIRVRDGIYYETLNLFGKGIWIESEHGPLTCTLSAEGLTNVFFVPPAQIPATIRGFTLAAAFNVIFMDDGAQLNVFNNMFISDSVEGFSVTFLFSGFCGGNVVNNFFSGSATAIAIASVLGTLENNVIQEASNVALWNRAGSGNTIVHAYNLFWQNYQNYSPDLSLGPGEFVADPLLDVLNGHLLEGSPCLDSGDPNISDFNGSRSDVGPFGGPWAY